MDNDNVLIWFEYFMCMKNEWANAPEGRADRFVETKRIRRTYSKPLLNRQWTFDEWALACNAEGLADEAE